MGDEIINKTILNSEEPGLQKARNILERIERRELYRFVAEITGTIEDTNFHYEEELNLTVVQIHTDMGKKKKNPVTDMLFFDKDSGEIERRSDEDLEHLAPGRVDFDKLYVLLRDQNPSAEVEEEAKKKFQSLVTKRNTEGKNWKAKYRQIQKM